MGRKAAIIWVSILSTAVGIFLILFVSQYRNLGDTIERERITYVTEIKSQMVGNIQMEKNVQMSMVNLYGRLIKKTKPSHFSDLKDMLEASLLGEKDTVFLLDMNGFAYNLDGERKKLSDRKLAQSLLVDQDPVFSYVQVNDAEEYWVYGESLEGLTLDGIPIGALISAREIHNFSARMATGILNNEGFTYVVSHEGNVLVYPDGNDDIGYNLFTSLLSSGAQEETVDRMAEDFSQGKGGQEFLSYGGNRWLISYSSDIFDGWVVVVLMPMTITAASTYEMLNHTMVSVILLLASILTLMLVLINLFYQRERARESAIQQEKLRLEIANRTAESKNQFLAKMSHDIRTPLNAIMGLLKMTEGLVVGLPKVEDNLRKLKQSAEYLLSILNDVLDMSKIESGKMQIDSAPFLLGELLSAIETMNNTQAAAKNLDFSIEVMGSPGPDVCYMGDRLRLNQILMNLLSNAIKFTDPGGRVRLYINITPAEEGIDCLKFVVEDTGIGMSEEYLEHIFQPFEQEKASVALNYSGSGLGLSIVKNLVDLMGGDIRVVSEKGRGSRFTVILRLPQAELPQEKIADIGDIPELSLKGYKLLLAEDNELNAMIASELITAQYGMEVDIAENGQLALERFAASEEREYAAILMDIRMPVMDGLNAARAIRALEHPRARTVPIIAMSANAFQEDVALSLESGMNAHLSKPFDVDKLEQTLKIWIRKERDGNETVNHYACMRRNNNRSVGPVRLFCIRVWAAPGNCGA